MPKNTKKNSVNPKIKEMGSAASRYHHGDLARALVLAGRKILSDKGTDGLSLRAVAAKAGVSQAAPYTHFGSKKDLLRAISASGYSELADKMLAGIKAQSDSVNSFVDCGVAYIEFSINNPDIYRLMFAQIDPNARSTNSNKNNSEIDILDREAARAYGVLFDLYKAQCKDLEKATNLSHVAWGLVHGLASLITEGLIQIPKTNRHKHLRKLLIISQIRVPE